MNSVSSSEVALPYSWVEVEIGDVAQVKGGKRLPKGKSLLDTPTEYPYIRVTDFDAGTVSFSNLKYLDENTQKEIKNYTISKDDLYISIAGTIGLIGDIPEQLDGANLTENAAKLCDLNGVQKSYLRHVLSSHTSHEQFQENTTSSGQPKLALFRIKSCCFPLPPLAEQKVIADKLDTLLAEVETTKARLERIPEILKSFRQSVLSAAVSGKLTEEWRESHSKGTGEEVVKADAINKSVLLDEIQALKKKKSTIESQIDTEYIFDLPESWVFTTWGKISEWITYGFTKPMPKSDSGVKLLTAKDVQYFDVNINDAGLTTSSAFQSLSDKDRPIKGDLLITKDGSIGRAALVRTDEPFCINQSVAVCWLRSTSMNKDYLEFLANSEFTQRFVKDKAQGMAIQHLSIIDYAKCPLPVPSLEEQTEIVRRVEELFALADSIEQKATAALARVNNLTQSILAKAFRGELTAEWRTANPEFISGDNSAAALLEKIKAERAVLAPSKKSRASKKS